ncbi:hypothetical protein DERP_004991 [Dermatophagoides pteronyssinus]|uniref:Uncharacterized protein n=1 Tax=Dermatophagoides pteronyssinus TaxID=6956 RepID=A0ABQ8JT27_DERPT|nr:hypothetical protein DERP_004991 [Dermatophagoides pteronyssinus]
MVDELLSARIQMTFNESVPQFIVDINVIQTQTIPSLRSTVWSSTTAIFWINNQKKYEPACSHEI